MSVFVRLNVCAANSDYTLCTTCSLFESQVGFWMCFANAFDRWLENHVWLFILCSHRSLFCKPHAHHHCEQFIIDSDVSNLSDKLVLIGNLIFSKFKKKNKTKSKHAVCKWPFSCAHFLENDKKMIFCHVSDVEQERFTLITCPFPFSQKLISFQSSYIVIRFYILMS